jgi:Tol biopolymer transport system component
VHKPEASDAAYLLDLKTGELVARDDATALGCWSPDGQYVAAYSTADHEIHILATSGDEVWAVDTESERMVVDMFWLPASSDGSEDHGRFLILTVPAHTNGVARLSLSSALTGQEVTWTQVTDDDTYVANVAVSPDGRWAAFGRGQLGATGIEADLYLLNLASGQSQQLTQDGIPTCALRTYSKMGSCKCRT